MIKKSPWISALNIGECTGCIIEIIALKSPKYDIERFGCIMKESARHADILLVAGALNKQSKERLKRIYAQMPEDKAVLAVGACAISGGVYANAYNVIPGIDRVIPVDVYIPGCPPRPEAIIDGLLKALRRLNAKHKK